LKNDADPGGGGSADAAQARRQRLIGIGLMCLTVTCFTGIDSTAKYLGGQMDTLQIVWARYAFAFVLALIITNPVSNPSLMRTSRLKLQVFRSFLLLLSTVANFIALRYLRLDQTVTIGFSAPFMVAALAGPILGEVVGLRRWIAIMVGFLGVLVVTRPGFGGIHPAALFTLLGMGSYALYIIITRMLSYTDSSSTTLFYSNLVGAAAVSFVVPFVWTTPQSWLVVLLMVFMGACAMTGHYLLILAYRLAPTAVIAPFIYSQIVSGIIAGYVIFGDLPDRWTLIGAAIVVASGLYLLYLEQRVAPVRRASS
jgi:drug/metabolite transporter (DMT)-like permease